MQRCHFLPAPALEQTITVPGPMVHAASMDHFNKESTSSPILRPNVMSASSLTFSSGAYASWQREKEKKKLARYKNNEH